MRDVPRHVETVRTADTHLKDDPCALHSEDHKIAARFHHVMVSARDALDTNMEIFAGGCYGCVMDDLERHFDNSAYIYYIAQTDCIDRIALSYGTVGEVGIKLEEIGQALVTAAEGSGVNFSWNGDGAKPVYLGDTAVYDKE